MPKHPIDLSVIVLALPYSESPKNFCKTEMFDKC